MGGREMDRKRLFKILSIAWLILLLVGCGTPETKKM